MAIFNKSGSFLTGILLSGATGKGFEHFNKLLLSATFCHFLPVVATFLINVAIVSFLNRVTYWSSQNEYVPCDCRVRSSRSSGRQLTMTVDLVKFNNGSYVKERPGV